MVTLQEYLDNKYKTKEEREKVEEINIGVSIDGIENIDGDLLIIKNYHNLKQLWIFGCWLRSPVKSLEINNCPNLRILFCQENNLTTLDLSNFPNLELLTCSCDDLTSVDFLTTLTNPDKLMELVVYDNKIQPTDIAFFSKFKNLRALRIGITEEGLRKGKRNYFYGSLKSLQSLTKLEELCIANTDVEEGLEYIPTKIAELSAKAVKEGKKPMELNLIDCQSFRDDAKVAKIQNELRPFNYDLEAWQLAHSEKMLIARPELFTNPDSKDKWLTALNNKIKESKETLSQIVQNEADKTAKIARLETKIAKLQEVKETLEKSTQTEMFTANKQTQTDLTGQDYEKQQKQNQELREKLNKLTIEKK